MPWRVVGGLNGNKNRSMLGSAPHLALPKRELAVMDMFPARTFAIAILTLL
jgi:hypothetical protein